MGLFRFSAKNHHSKMCRFLSACLIFSLLLTFGVSSVQVAFAAAGNADLSAIYLSGVSAINNFDPDTTEYTVYLPYSYVDGEEVAPTLTVTGIAADPEATVTVENPLELTNDSLVTITVAPSEGGSEKVYTLTLKLIGKNKYENGGFETAENTNVKHAAVYDVPSRRDDAACNGTYNIAVRPSDSKVYMYHPSPVVEDGKTYISSITAKLFDIDEVTPEKIAASNFCLMTERVNINTSSTNHKVYRDGELVATNWLGSLGGLEKGTLHRLDSIDTIVLSDSTATGNLSVWLADNGKQNLPVYEDDFYFSELVIASGEILDSYGNVPTELQKPAYDYEEYSLTASFKNQFGALSGLESVVAERWELAEEYDGVEINNDGVLTVSTDAPDSIGVIAYAFPTFGDQTCVKAERTITLAEPDLRELSGLVDIRINGFSVPGFNTVKTKYDMYIPYSYVPNKLMVTGSPSVEVIGDGVDINVEKTGYINNGRVAVTASQDGIERTYEIDLYTIGDNMFADGGFEDGVSQITGLNVEKFSQITDNVGAGSKAMRVEPKANNYITYNFKQVPTLKAGKKYVLSNMIRLDGSEVETFTYRNQNEDIANVVTVEYYEGDFLPGDTTAKVTVGKEWKTVRTIYTVQKDWQAKQYYVDAAWVSQPPFAVDEYYLGELTIGSIEYNGATQFAIPLEGVQEYTLEACTLKNQFGFEAGLAGERAVWEFVGNPEGVSIEGNKLIVTERAAVGTIYLRANVTPSFNSTYTISRTFAVTLNADEELAKMPVAYDVSIDGEVVAENELTGVYSYHNQLGVAESGTTYRWLYADTKGGAKKEIPEANSQTYVVEEDYADKYIFFEVTPCSEEGVAGKAAVSEYVTKPLPPIAYSVKIEGVGAAETTVKGSYLFYDENGDKEEGSTYQWSRSDSLNGTYTPIDGATELEYTVSEEDDYNKYIRFEVIPKSEKLPDVLPGTSYYSVGMLVAAPPIVEDVEIEKVMNGLYRVSYSYKHPLGITEGKSKIQWYLDGNPAGTETSQEIGNGVSTIKVSITPIASQKPFKGTTVSATKTISKSNSSSTGGGGGGRFNESVQIKNDSFESVPSVTPTNPPVRHWAADGIDFVKKNAIMQDQAPGNFGNTTLVTRADFIYYVMKTLGFEGETYAQEFGDVGADVYYANLLQQAVNMGIISRDENFYPMRSVSRQEVCKIVVLALELKTGDAISLDKFADKGSVASWATGYVDTAVKTGMLVGVSENEFLPLGNITREQTAVIMKRLYDYKCGGEAQ